MRNRVLFFAVLAALNILLALSSNAAELPKVDSKFVRVSDSCDVKSPKKFVYFFKQWHLSPTVNTRASVSDSLKLPQHVNQTAIYKQIDQWIQRNDSIELIAEGCPAPRAIDAKSPEKFNGWTVADLSERSSDPSYADIVTNVAYKIEAKWKTKVKTQCGDNAEAMKEILLAFSDSRGILGYSARLQQYQSDPEQSKIYLDGVIESFHLPKDTTIPQAQAELNRQLKGVVDRIEHWIDVRNEKLVDEIASSPETDPSIFAVVFGGVHAAGVKKLLEAKGIGCTILEPKGYKDDEATLVEQLKLLVDQRMKQSG
jgi:hypothetical protein